jgi:hypothetical protein
VRAAPPRRGNRACLTVLQRGTGSAVGAPSRHRGSQIATPGAQLLERAPCQLLSLADLGYHAPVPICLKSNLTAGRAFDGNRKEPIDPPFTPFGQGRSGRSQNRGEMR